MNNIDVSTDIIETMALIDSILEQYQQLSRALLVKYKDTYESIQKVMEMI